MDLTKFENDRAGEARQTMSEAMDAELEALVKEARSESPWRYIRRSDAVFGDKLADAIERLLAEKQAAVKERDDWKLRYENAQIGYQHVDFEDAKLIEENRVLREALWEHHSHQGKYGDDGEIQCQGVDFKRDPINIIQRHLMTDVERALAAAAMRDKEQQ